MPESSKTIAILASDPEQLAEWGGWLAADGFHIHPSYNAVPATLPENIALVLFCRERLKQTPNLVDQLREYLPLAPLLCATSAADAAEVLASGVDDIVTTPISAPVLQNRVRQMLPHAANFTETIQRTAAALVGQNTQHDLLELVLRQIKLVMPDCDATNIVLIGPDGDEMLIAHHAAYFDPNDESERTILRKFDRKLSELPNFQKMVETRHPLLIRDRHQEADWVPMKDTHWVRCYLGAPVIVQNEVIGFINVDSATPSAFNARQANQLRGFAYHVGVAIYHTRLIEQLTSIREKLAETVETRTSELATEKARLQIILDSIGEGVVYYDDNGKPMFINHAVEKLFGYDGAAWREGRADIISDDVSKADIARLDQQVDRALAQHGIWQISGPVKRADGSHFDVQVTIHPQTNGNGRVVVYRDISQEKSLMERQARFVAYASHELRTPITNIQTQLYLVRRRPERAAHHLSVIEEVVSRMTKLVENLLTLSRLGNGQITTEMAEIDLRDVVLAVHRVQGAEAARADIRLALVLPAESIVRSADHERLVQVITNLTVNALLHTEPGRQVTLRLVRTFSPTADKIHSNPAIYENGIADNMHDWAVVHVEDEGNGISADHLPHLFQPFYRADNGQPGTGLGLTIAAEIARLHGGTLTVASKPGKGSTFSLWLPLAPAEEAATS